MAITVSENKKGYLSLSLKWDTGVMFEAPVALVVSLSNRIAVIAKFKCSGTTMWNEVAKKHEPFLIQDKIAVASFNKKESQYAKVTEYDKIIVEKLEPFNNKVVSLKVNSPMFNEAFGLNGFTVNPSAEQFALNITESIASDSYLAELQTIASILKETSRGGGATTITPELQIALMQARLDFLDANLNTISTKVAELHGLIYYSDVLWTGKDNSVPPQFSLDVVISCIVGGLLK